jgi:hypothetical protein
MANSLTTLKKELKKVGFQLVPSFDTRITPGSIIHRPKWNDLSKESHINYDKAIKAMSLDVEGPALLGIQNFVKGIDFTVGASAKLLNLTSASAKASFAKVKQVAVSFETPLSNSMNLDQMSDAINSDPLFWTRATGRRLLQPKRYVAYQVVTAKIALVFLGKGNIAVGVKARTIGDLKSAGLSSTWKWRNEYSLESKKELVIAVDLAVYDEDSQLMVQATKF